jgi:hypothetical protein
MTAVILFVSTYFLVFFLGLQSLVVNSGNKYAAFMISFVIGVMNLALFKLAPNANEIEIIAYLSGGPFGIVSAMSFFAWWKKKK